VDKATRATVVWTSAGDGSRIGPMRFIFWVILTAFAYVCYMVGDDVFVHDQTFGEAWKGSPHQLIQNMGQLATMAWQYKFVSLIFFGIVSAILLVRLVPDVKNQVQRR
jgi:hypothetical protein